MMCEANLARMPGPAMENALTLKVICSKAIVFALRKQLFWDMYEMGVNAPSFSISPTRNDEQLCLSVQLDCTEHQRPALQQMAERFEQAEQIIQIDWSIPESLAPDALRA